MLEAGPSSTVPWRLYCTDRTGIIECHTHGKQSEARPPRHVLSSASSALAAAPSAQRQILVLLRGDLRSVLAGSERHTRPWLETTPDSTHITTGLSTCSTRRSYSKASTLSFLSPTMAEIIGFQSSTHTKYDAPNFTCAGGTMSVFPYDNALTGLSCRDKRDQRRTSISRTTSQSFQFYIKLSRPVFDLNKAYPHIMDMYR